MIQPNSAMWFFLLETYVNEGAQSFTLGSSLFDMTVSRQHNAYQGPMGIVLRRRDSLHTTLSDWAILYNTLKTYEDPQHGQTAQTRVKHKVDWIDVRDDYDPA